MRTYIFTQRERRVIQAFLEGKVGISDGAIQQIRSRVKGFALLSGDVDLYLELRRRFAESSTADSE